jgi:FixJ family two-component response regulator
MIDHDKNVGQALDYLDELGIADKEIAEEEGVTLCTIQQHRAHVMHS